MRFLSRCDDAPALICGDLTISHAALAEHVRRFAGALGLEAGSRVAISAENRLEWVYALYGTWQAGGVAVPVDAQSTAEEVAYILGDCRPAVVVGSRQREAVLREAIASSGVPSRLLLMDDYDAGAAAAGSGAVDEVDPEQTAAILYTSGTTGSPKGVMLSFGNLHSIYDSISVTVPIYRPDDRVLALLPLHHILPLQGTVLMPLFMGATCVFCPSMRSEDILAALQQHRVTLMVGVPRLFTLLRDGLLRKIRANAVARVLFRVARAVNSLGFSRVVFKKVQAAFGGHLRYMCCGGAAIEESVVADLRVLGFEVLTGYGMTETAPIMSFTRPGAYRAGAAGQVIAVNEVQSIEGEICVRGANVMKGYYQRPADTAAVIRDGWLHTGDLGHLDAEGYLFITGRLKEILVLPNGKKINPEEIEAKLMAWPGLQEVAVLQDRDVLHAVAVPDLAWLGGQGIVNIEQWLRWNVLDRYNRQAAPSKRLHGFSVIREGLPRTRLGKLKRHELSALLAPPAERTGPVEEPASECYGLLRDYLAEAAGRRVRPEDHIELDLGLDSLDKVALQVWLGSTFGVSMSEADLSRCLTVAQLAEHVDAGKTRQGAVESIPWGQILREKVALRLPGRSLTAVGVNRLLGLLARGYFRLQGEGMEKLPDGPCIIAPNHQSALDGLFVTAFLRGRALRNTYFYAKAEHVRRWWVRFLANHHNIVVVDMNRDLKASLQKLAMILREGRKVVIFPEGTRSRDGSLGQFRKTFAILGRELQVPIVPVAIRGAYEALPAGGRIPRPFRRIQVRFLDPVYPAEESYSSLADKVFQAVATGLR